MALAPAWLYYPLTLRLSPSLYTQAYIYLGIQGRVERLCPFMDGTFACLLDALSDLSHIEPYNVTV